MSMETAESFALWFEGVDVDTISTAANVRQFFKKDYPKLLRMAGVSSSYVKSPVLSDEPKAPLFGNSSENKMKKRIYAQQTLECVARALDAIRYESKQILIAVYADKLNVWDVCELIGCERAQYQLKKRKAENEFADAFETCCDWWRDLHVYK
ncbi:ArpU family phage packaging/lysis transcriptional regulator [Lactobacillus sp. AN1001]